MSQPINYEEAFIKFLNSNYFKELPDQNIIDSNREVAKAVWSNYYIPTNHYDNSLSFIEWYKKGKINEVLENYANDIDFWEENFKKIIPSYGYEYNNPYDLLLDDSFKADFPVIAQYFLSSNERLMYIFEVTKNKQFFNLIDLPPDQKDQIIKDNILNQSHSYSVEEFKKFEDDEQFVFTLLKRDINCYNKLSIDNPNYLKYTQYAATIYKGYYLLSDENKEKFFETFFKLNSHEIDFKSLSKFTEQQKEIILLARMDLALLTLNDNKLHDNIVIRWLNHNFNNFILAATNTNILQIIKIPKVLDVIKPQLENFIENYKVIKESNLDKKLTLLVEHSNDNLLDRLKENKFYQLNNELNLIEKDKLKKDSSWFNIISKNLLIDYNSGIFSESETYEYLAKMKRNLSIEAQKELQLPAKNMLTHLSKKYLYEKLEKELPHTTVINKKIKI